MSRRNEGSGSFVRNEELTLPGFSDEREAALAAETIPRSSNRRVKVAFRSRTGTYDVVVKDRSQGDT